jgi:hypothetical protein
MRNIIACLNENTCVKILAAVIIMAGCMTQLVFAVALDCQPNPEHHPDSLMTIAGATNAAFLHCKIPDGGEQDQLMFTLKRPYPASDVIKEISEALSKKGWKPLKEDYLNSSLPTSQVRGWTDSLEAQKDNNLKKEFSWDGDWRNSSGDIVTYVFRYRVPLKDKRDYGEVTASKASALYVVAFYLPVERVKSLQEWTAKHRGENIP